MCELPNPHDALFKATFASPRRAASQFRALLPAPLAAALDPEALEQRTGGTVNDELRERYGDLQFETTMAGIPVVILYEHQSTADQRMPFRLLRYMVRVWDHLPTQHGRAPRRLPLIIPVVLYHGTGRWKAPVQLDGMIEMPADLQPEAGRHIPRFDFLLDDLNLHGEQELLARGGDCIVKLTLLLFHQQTLDADLLAVLHTHAELLCELGRRPDWRTWLHRYVTYIYTVGEVPRDGLVDLVGATVGAQAREVAMTTAEKLKQEGRKEARTEILINQLRQKFGGAVTSAALHRIALASSADLDLWLSRVLTTDSVDEVLSASPT